MPWWFTPGRVVRCRWIPSTRCCSPSASCHPRGPGCFLAWQCVLWRMVQRRAHSLLQCGFSWRFFGLGRASNRMRVSADHCKHRRVSGYYPPALQRMSSHTGRMHLQGGIPLAHGDKRIHRFSPAKWRRARYWPLQSRRPGAAPMRFGRIAGFAAASRSCRWHR